MRWTKKLGWFGEIVSLHWTVGCYLHGMETSVVCTRLGEIRNRHGMNRHTTMHTKYNKIHIRYISIYIWVLSENREYIPKFMQLWIFHISYHHSPYIFIYLLMKNGYLRIGPAVVTTPRGPGAIPSGRGGRCLLHRQDPQLCGEASGTLRHPDIDSYPIVYIYIFVCR